MLRFVITRKLFRRVFPYGLLIGYLFLEMYAAYNQKRDLFADRFTVLGLILLFFSLYLLKIRIKGKALAFSILFLWILGLILTVHTAFLFGNGNGFSLENVK